LSRAHLEIHTLPTRRSSDLESYDMHERTFKNITEKDIKNQLPEYYTIDNLFNKETIKDILENAPGNHNLFEFGEQAEESTQTEEDRKSTRLNSSHDSISYAV